MRRLRAHGLAPLLALLLSPLLSLLLSAGTANANVVAPSLLNSAGQQGWQAYLDAPSHRAFAIAPGGGWGWSQGEASAQAAATAALNVCQPHSQYPCQVYAVDQRVTFNSRIWAQGWRPYASRAEATRATTGTQRGQRFPDLRLSDESGRATSISNWRGKVVVLHFWGSWCPVCRHELPQFKRLEQAFQGKKDIAFVYVPVRESVTQARAYLRQHGLNLAQYDALQGGSGKAFNLANGQTLPDRDIAPVFPATLVLDRHGIVVFKQLGDVPDWAAYAPLLEDLRRAR
jgi:thiol-disulfide isomerase/thioredoxin